MLGGGSDGAHGAPFSRNLQEKNEPSPSTQSTGAGLYAAAGGVPSPSSVAVHAAAEVAGRAGREEQDGEAAEHEQRDRHRRRPGRIGRLRRGRA